ncbi:Oidioi.mRNA.OKI2018_I69.chr2.g6045.t1.cds [Oikopleura dioica]|uniref:Oidioi.mRNA.OKI2018_I69.chr2.g6045.t1.cds n=1 Tax=Oikopleura dioica TaxID=34765 RepID=A0ABN7T2R3_OIKDI|nr:Oidioi.mRNA.OKI2018_I69.chr2.g6045.t1.cds [Oikopleura dioica]
MESEEVIAELHNLFSDNVPYMSIWKRVKFNGLVNETFETPLLGRRNIEHHGSFYDITDEIKAAFSTKLDDWKCIDPGSLRMKNFKRISPSSKAFESFLMSGKEVLDECNGQESYDLGFNNKEVYLLMQPFNKRLFLIPKSGSNNKDAFIRYTEIDSMDQDWAAISTVKFTIQDKEEYDRLKQSSKPPSSYVIPDWVEKESQERMKQERKKQEMQNSKKSSKKKPSKQKIKSNQPKKNDISAQIADLDIIDRNAPSGEREPDNETDWLTVGAPSQEEKDSQNPPMKPRASPPDASEKPPTETEKSALVELVESTDDALPAESQGDRALKAEVSELQEKLERYEMCPICFERYDEDEHAKYSHQCGHGCCLTCMKMEFARQRNLRKMKFYCHCGFEIHEKKIIRMFI